MSATAPTDPTREGYFFVVWDKTFDTVTSNLTITAQYVEESLAPTIVISNSTASVGDTNVEVTIAIKNNPGVALLDFKVTFDPNALTLNDVTYNSEFGGSGTKPNPMGNPVQIMWYNGDENSEGDMVFVTLTFSVPESASAGDTDITVTYTTGGICNWDEEDIEFYIVNGKITIL